MPYLKRLPQLLKRVKSYNFRKQKLREACIHPDLTEFFHLISFIICRQPYSSSISASISSIFVPQLVAKSDHCMIFIIFFPEIKLHFFAQFFFLFIFQNYKLLVRGRIQEKLISFFLKGFFSFIAVSIAFLLILVYRSSVNSVSNWIPRRRPFARRLPAVSP